MSRTGVPLLYLLPPPESYTSVPRRFPGWGCVTLPQAPVESELLRPGDQLLFFPCPVSATPVTKLPQPFTLCVPRPKLLCHRLVILGEAHSAVVRILHQTFASLSFFPLTLLLSLVTRNTRTSHIENPSRNHPTRVHKSRPSLSFSIARIARKDSLLFSLDFSRVASGTVRR